MLFPENIGRFLSIDEMALSNGELYTFVTNKQGKGKKGTLVASIKGTLSNDIVSVLHKLTVEQRDVVKEVSLDMANNMESSIRQSFTKANLVTDRFHVIKLAIEALQHLRVKHRWEELDKENIAIAEAKKQGKRYKSEALANGDTPKQLLSRSRFILAKKPNDWTKIQKQRADLLFAMYPDLKTAYYHVLEFRNIYETNSKSSAKQRFINWINKTNEFNFKEFNTVANTVKSHLDNILNFFNYRNTNANAESFNAKIKLFRANLRGVVDTNFFLFRVKNLFA